MNQVTLAHGNQDDQSAPLLLVEVSSPPDLGDDQQVRSSLVREFRARSRPPPTAPQPVVPPPREGKGVSVWAVTVGSSEPTEASQAADPSASNAWRSLLISIDANPVAFSCFEEAGAWVSWARLGGLMVKVHGRRWPTEQIELVRVLDIEPYCTGSFRSQDSSGT